MALPDVSLSVTDGALGQLPANTDNLVAHIGPSSAGDVDTPVLIADLATLRAKFGTGPLVEAIAHQLATAGGPAIGVRGTAASAGAAGAVTQAGSADAPVVSVAGAANDAYEVVISIVKAGARGTATFRYSLDGEQTRSIETVVPAGGSYVLADTGLTLTFPAGTYVADDRYTFVCTPPRMDATGLASAMQALYQDSNDFAVVHVIGNPSSAANAKLLADQAATEAGAGATSYRYTVVLVDGAPIDGTSVTTANTKSAFASLDSNRVGIAAGSALIVSPINGRRLARPFGWAVASRIAAVPVHEDLGRVASGPLAGVAQIDLTASEAADLDGARFITPRTLVGRAGFFVANGKLMASEGSDYQHVQFRRVMDKASKIARGAAMEYLNDSVRLNADGTILEQEALAIEADIASHLETGLVAPGNATAVSVAISRTENIASSQRLPITIRVRARGYAKTITIDIGFENPALAQA